LFAIIFYKTFPLTLYLSKVPLHSISTYADSYGQNHFIFHNLLVNIFRKLQHKQYFISIESLAWVNKFYLEALLTCVCASLFVSHSLYRLGGPFSQNLLLLFSVYSDWAESLKHCKQFWSLLCAFKGRHIFIECLCTFYSFMTHEETCGDIKRMENWEWNEHYRELLLTLYEF
jgi:hypothetical protein